MFRRLAALLTCLLCIGSAGALTPEAAAKIAAGDSDDRIAALNASVVAGDAALVPFVRAMLDDEVKTAGGKAFIVKDGKAVEAGSGAACGCC
jgi:urea transport system permease protein